MGAPRISTQDAALGNLQAKGFRDQAVANLTRQPPQPRDQDIDVRQEVGHPAQAVALIRYPAPQRAKQLILQLLAAR